MCKSNIILYTLNVYSAVCQLYLNKTEYKERKQTKQASKNKELGKNRKFQSTDDTLVRKHLHLNQKMNICTTWFLVFAAPGRKPRTLYDCHNDTQSCFFYSSPITDSQNRDHWLSQPPGSCSCSMYLRKQESTWDVSVAWLLLPPSFNILLWECDVWGCGSHLASHKGKVRTSQSHWPSALGESALEPTGI